jgi:hypothetical protein
MFSEFMFQKSNTVKNLEILFRNRIKELKNYQFVFSLVGDDNGISKYVDLEKERKGGLYYVSLDGIKKIFRTLRDNRIKTEQSILDEYLKNKDYYDKKLNKRKT